jgi:hypothetical protein
MKHAYDNGRAAAYVKLGYPDWVSRIGPVLSGQEADKAEGKANWLEKRVDRRLRGEGIPPPRPRTDWNARDQQSTAHYDRRHYNDDLVERLRDARRGQDPRKARWLQGRVEKRVKGHAPVPPLPPKLPERSLVEDWARRDYSENLGDRSRVARQGADEAKKLKEFARRGLAAGAVLSGAAIAKILKMRSARKATKALPPNV